MRRLVDVAGGVDADALAPHDLGMPADDQPDDDRLDPREAARARRRDRDLDAERRDLLRPGMGKVFKQITDSWADKASPDQAHRASASRAPGRTRRTRGKDDDPLAS